LGQLILARLREFYRQPERVFWVYGFPILTMVALGIAFRNKEVQKVSVDVIEGPLAQTTVSAFPGQFFTAKVFDAETCRRRLRTGKTDLVVEATGPGRCAFHYDRSRPESAIARDKTDDALQRAAGRADVARVADNQVSEPGGRYIDFLVPGLVGASIMGGGLWGVAFVAVDLRMRNLLKRFLATPMRRSYFLIAIMASRLAFKITEVILLLLCAYFIFDVAVRGSILVVAMLILVGAVTFSGIGLLVGCRARTLEAVSGLMNAVMLPMWTLSGIFFASDRFPAVAQPFIKVLPLTALIDALRAVMLEGKSLLVVWPQVAVMAAWSIITFVLALRWFRWY
jgi:ABC-type multidrug transport system permease subunit